MTRRSTASDQGGARDRRGQRRQGAGERRHDQGRRSTNSSSRRRSPRRSIRSGRRSANMSRPACRCSRSSISATSGCASIFARISPRGSRSATGSRCGSPRSATGRSRPRSSSSRPRGEYAGWRATRATGDFDLRTFEVRAYPVAPLPGASAGHERLRRVAKAGYAMKRRRGRDFCSSPRANCAGCGATGVALFLAIVVPLIAFALLARRSATRSSAIWGRRSSTPTARRPRSSMCRRSPRRPASASRERSGDMTSAMQAIRSGDAIAAVYIPREFRARSPRPQAPADRRSLQPAIFHPRQQRRGGHLERGGRRDRDAAARDGRRAATRRGPSSLNNTCSPIRR